MAIPKVKRIDILVKMKRKDSSKMEKRRRKSKR
jgi:hypothetical protein